MLIIDPRVAEAGDSDLHLTMAKTLSLALMHMDAQSTVTQHRLPTLDGQAPRWSLAAMRYISQPRHRHYLPRHPPHPLTCKLGKRPSREDLT